MNKILLVLLLFSNLAFTQVSGDLADDNRVITNDIVYTVNSSKTGHLVFDIIVDRKGKVTSCILNKDETNIVSTPTMMKAKNRIMQELTFEVNYTAPERHQGVITIQVHPPTNE